MDDLKNPIGSLVRYYLEGWRYGHLVADNGNTSIVSPIAAFKATQPKNVRVPTMDVEKSDLNGGK